MPLLDTRLDLRYFRNFYLRRTLRIFPLYYVVVAISFLLVPWCLSHLPQYAAKLTRFSTVSSAWPWYLLYCSNYVIAWNNAYHHGILDVSWSLSIEEQYYLVWAICVYVLSKRSLTWVCALSILLLPFLRIALLALGTGVLQVYVLTPTRLDGVLWGSLLALALRDKSLRCVLDRTLKPAGLACGVVVLGLALAGKWDYLGRAELGFGYSAVALGFAALLWVTYHNNGVLRHIFEQRWLRFLGVYSYSLYLFHLPLRALIRDTVFGDKQFRALSPSAIPGQLLFYGITLVAVIPFSLLSWRFLEQPLLKLKSRFFHPRLSIVTIGQSA